MVKLTAKQQRFVDEYLIDFNATQAAIRAGYSAKTAYSIGNENLNKPEILAALAAAKKAQTERTQIDADSLLQRLDDEANADIADILNDDGLLKPVKQWPMVWRRGLISGVEIEQIFKGK